MDESAAILARAIGSRVKQERQHRGWTLDRLATAAGVSRRMLVNVEQGSVNPSVGTLLRLSDALGVGLPALVEPPEPRETKMTRAGSGAVLWTGPAGGRGVLVSGTESPDVVELWDWTLEVGEELMSEAHSHGTREILQVWEGQLCVVVDGEHHDLAAGDALTFWGDVPHGYVNESELVTRFSLTVFEPRVSAARQGEDGDG